MKPETGQVWRNKATGQEVTVLGVPDRSYLGYVAHKGKRTAYTVLMNFLKKYEFVREGENE